MSIWENDGMNGVDSIEVHEDIIQSILSTPSTLQFLIKAFYLCGFL